MPAGAKQELKRRRESVKFKKFKTNCGKQIIFLIVNYLIKRKKI